MGKINDNILYMELLPKSTRYIISCDSPRDVLLCLSECDEPAYEESVVREIFNLQHTTL